MPEYTLTDQDNGKAYTVSLDTQMTIQLAENPTTGYTWVADRADEEVVRITDAGYTSPEGAALGQGGAHTFLVTPKSVGTAEVQLKRRRSWQGEGAAAEHFQVTVTVAAISQSRQGHAPSDPTHTQ